jgi:putative ABC transport system substrate-binding protein
VKRRQFAAAALLAAPSLVRAQPAVREVGFVHPGTGDGANTRLQAFASGLKQRGFGNDRVSVIARWAENDPARLAAGVDELIQRKVSALLLVGRPATLRARAATKTIPLIALDLESDPVRSGFIETLSRPGGNLTGLYFDFPEFSGKLLQLLSETVPGIGRLAVLWDPTSGPTPLDTLKVAAAERHLPTTVLNVEKPDNIDVAIRAAVQGGAQAAIALASPVFGTEPKRLAHAAVQAKLPLITQFPEYAEMGGLMAYGISIVDLFRQGGEVVGKVLAGTTPAELPVERPSRFRLVVNTATAKAMGLTIPGVVLARADEVIE